VSEARVEERLQHIVRDHLLVGSDRELSLDAPLGELGLDSLAMVNFLTSVESSFGVALPDDAWIAREPLTLEGVAALIKAAGAEEAATGPRNVPASTSSRRERLERALAKRGAPGRVAWWGILRLRRVQWFLFDRTRNVVLERRLDVADWPRIVPPPGVELRPYEADDDTLIGLWPPLEERKARRELALAMARGASALVACEGKRIVALDLLSATGEKGVHVSKPGACYGFMLEVAPAARGRGVGTALLAYSLGVAREQGFRAQLTFVKDNNREMLATATHVLGFRPIGRARRTRIAGRLWWSWAVDGVRGAGRELVL
jgi:acyl carrier protein/GNAT superfamily N-acetyltransferase